MSYPTIDARAAWHGDNRECAKLYRQFATVFKGRFAAIRAHYGWKRMAMLSALRIGRTADNAITEYCRDRAASGLGSHNGKTR